MGARGVAGSIMELSWLALLGISVGLAMDAFAVAVAAGMVLESVTPRHIFRLGFHFGLFQFVMPIVGWWTGERLAGRIEGYDRWVAFVLLGYVAAKCSGRAKKDGRRNSDPTRGWRLLTLSLATSIDALAVGMSMAFLGVSVWLPSVVIGVVTATLTGIGATFGSRIGSPLGTVGPKWPAGLY